MASRYLDLDTVKFLLYNVHDLDGVLAQERFKDYDRASVDLFLNAVSDFSDKELFPYFQEMDARPAHFEDGEVHVHPQVTQYMKKAGEMGLAAALFDHEVGGLQMPNCVVTAAAYIQESANNHLPGYIGLTFGAAELILHFGNEHLKKTYVPNMLSGAWNGTMCLTEPQAGSSLSDIVTSAEPDGEHYLISGQKIFISGGDYKGVENVVHLVLARIKGAPAGTKGISLFVVPKHRPDGDGQLVFNDVNTVGDFQKMGQRGYCTTHLSFGDKKECRGWLVGEPHQGLKYMFLMMNGARIAVGRGAAAIAMAAYRASLAYAKERPQGRKLTSTGKKDVSEAQTLIINHPDVKRMLLTQKVIVEGALSLVLLSAKYQDLSLTHPEESERKKYHYLLELLTPVAKTYPSEKGLESVSNGVQVLGGYGYCSDFILQQYYRDIRIFSIYEGTTGIQSMDLLGRKVTMDQGVALTHLAGEMGKTIKEAMGEDSLKSFAGVLAGKTDLMKKVLNYLMGYAGKGNYERFLADATVFMDFFGNILIGWLWLDMSLHANKALSDGATKHSAAFYKSKIHAMRFYYTYELPKSEASAAILLNTSDLTVSVDEGLFE
ncbi:acyl-CoA dehydrogenase [Robiginitalea aurantiaca]|uniref:Acyl-CoA dehydrogenase n=1 Tax=Robiginitalea aurantiaca TaxID=3056915 RepID=A0ABT7WDY4_9FLAO|nr:acyl-CoA dehydrogenase [Robiginitalea aurantiaca]MDM9631127.1 acyl-CoA dehydrogenase [Robiginitalea aurantiaca]